MRLSDEQFIQLCEKVSDGYSLGYAFSFLGIGREFYHEILRTDPRVKALNACYVQIPSTTTWAHELSLEGELKRLESLVWELEMRLVEKDRVLTGLRRDPSFLPPLPAAH